MEALYALAIEYESNTGSLPLWGPASTANTVADAFDATPSGSFWDGYAIDANLECPSGGGYILVQSANLSECQFYYNNWGWECNSTNTGWTSSPGGRGFILFGLERGMGCLTN